MDDPDLVIAIRSNYLNVYWLGNSLLKITHERGRLLGRVHYKDLVRANRTPEYVVVEDGRPVIPDSASFLTQDIGEVRSLKAAAKPYAGAEKIGVHNIVMSNPNIVDVEVAFSVRGRAEEVAGNPRVDLEATSRDWSCSASMTIRNHVPFGPSIGRKLLYIIQ